MSNTARNAKEIFLDAVENYSLAEWLSFLDEKCGHDKELRKHVEELLQAHQKTDDLFDVEPTVDAAKAKTLIGETIGPYNLLQELGEGGMGSVYMAQKEKPVKRRVALKIIKAGMDSKQVIARFEAERQALAMMEHPNIAHLLDVGTTESGRPYFVMELVKGLPITEYCDAKRLDVEQRLELFASVCDAVQHAHQKGIIHRDLKPNNILVAEYDDRGIPKIIDFGLAKALHQSLTDKTMFTQLGQVLGTLTYMSPEQSKMNQLDVDTRTDIYSLGVLLYELLTGSTPFDMKRLASAAIDQVMKIIREEEPPRPSTRLSSTSESVTGISEQRKIAPAKLQQILRGELDWIVMKALEKDRTRRYETANGLALDVRRYLNDEAVTAKPPSAAYRLTKTFRRNRMAYLTGAGVLAILLLVMLAARLYVAAQRHENDRQRAVSLVASELVAPPQAVPYAIESLVPLRNHAIPILREKYHDASVDSRQRLNAALAMARFGQIEHEFLVNSIPRVGGVDGSNIVSALSIFPENGLDLINARANSVGSRENWRPKARYGIVAWHLNDASIVREMSNHPIERVFLIDELTSWLHSDLNELASLVENVEDGSLRSAVALGVGTVESEQISGYSKHAWQRLLYDWYGNKADSVTHSASGWALRQWQVRLPVISSSDHFDGEKQWHVNSIGMTLIKVSAGQFLRKRYLQTIDETALTLKDDYFDQKVKLTRPFLLADREVSRGQFEQFIDDGGIPDGNSADIRSQQEFNSALNHPAVAHPELARLFCNWLSKKEGLAPYYEVLEPRTNPIKWKLVPNANGYRLPTAAEWEYVFWSGNAPFGYDDRESLASRYFVYRSGRSEVCGSKLPNLWGFFDLGGNVAEWVEDTVNIDPIGVPLNATLEDLERLVDPDMLKPELTDPMSNISGDSYIPLALGGGFDESLRRIMPSPDFIPSFSESYSTYQRYGFRVARTLIE